MPELLPFRGLRYTGRDELSRVVAPPYDVIDEEERAALVAADPQNCVRLILPEAAEDCYREAARTLDQWRRDRVLAIDAEPALYRYRMTFATVDGPRTTDGVVGALVLPRADDRDEVLPHERTLPKARTDRLELLRATRANLDPIWALTLAPGLSDILHALPDRPPAARAVEPGGTRHELTPITEPTEVAALQAAVAAGSLLLADGHHRYETACAYRGERTAARDDPGAGAIMAFVVELAATELCVRAIHRLVGGPVPSGLRTALGERFAVTGAGPNTTDGVAALEAAMDAEAGIGLVDRDGLALLVATETTRASVRSAVPPSLHDVDAAVFDVAVRDLLGRAEVDYRNDGPTVAALVEKRAAVAAFLLRPPGIAAIRAVAAAGERMPEKTTYFAPKPRTGMVFRLLDA